MDEFLKHLTWWHWIVGGIALAALEAFVPGAVAIWFAISAGVVGLVLVAIPGLPWQLQWVSFAVLGIVAMVWYRGYKRQHPDGSEQPTLNQRGQQYVGNDYLLVEAIEQGSGKVRIGDTVWKVSGADAPAGTKVRVTGVDGIVLRVERPP